MEQLYNIIIGCVILSVMVIGGWIQRSREQKIWNNGINSNSGIPWRYFDSDSQGGRGYTDGNEYIWISYNVDKIL